MGSFKAERKTIKLGVEVIQPDTIIIENEKIIKKFLLRRL